MPSLRNKAKSHGNHGRSGSMNKLKLGKYGKVQQTSNPNLFVTCNRKSNSSVRSQMKLRKLGTRYAIVVSIASISSLLMLIFINLLGNSTVIVIDFVVNTFCIAFLSHWYGSLYSVVCCAAIKFSIYMNNKYGNEGNVITIVPVLSDTTDVHSSYCQYNISSHCRTIL